MTWARSDDKDVTNSTLIGVSVPARWLWHMMQVYIAADPKLYAQGGAFTTQNIKSVCGVQQVEHGDKLTAELVKAGLWQDRGHGCFFDPDWSHRNWSRERKAEWEVEHD